MLHVQCISIFECLKLNIFICFLRVTKFYTFSWNHSYITNQFIMFLSKEQEGDVQMKEKGVKTLKIN